MTASATYQLRLMLDNMHKYRRLYTQEQFERETRRILAIVELAEHNLNADVDLSDLGMKFDKLTWQVVNEAAKIALDRYRPMLQKSDPVMEEDNLYNECQRLGHKEDALRAIFAKCRQDTMARTPSAKQITDLLAAQQGRGISTSTPC